MQHGDYTSSPYYQFPHLQNPIPNSNPNPTTNPSNLQPNPYASAPPFTSGYTPSDYNPYPSNYPIYAQNSDTVLVPGSTPTPPTLVPPTAPSYSSAPIPNYQSPFNPTSQSPSLPPFESHSSYAPPAQQQSYYPTSDQHQTVATNYGTTPSLNTNPTPDPSYSSLYSDPHCEQPNSFPPAYGGPYENPAKFSPSGSYLDDYGCYKGGRPYLGSDIFGKRSDSGIARYDSGSDDLYDDGVYAYEGGKKELYGARGTAPKSSTWAGFDDYGRAISFPSTVESSKSLTKIVKAVPKADVQEDVKTGVQKFRVKLLAESSGQTTTDVLCQIGLDGIRMLDPSTSRTLRIYPLENIARCDKMDSSTLAFWSKSSVDIEPRRIRLQSNSYTTNTLLDTVTAATVQFKEMGGGTRLPDTLKTSEQPAEKKKGIVDWMNIIKPPNEEKEHWFVENAITGLPSSFSFSKRTSKEIQLDKMISKVPDEAVSKCTACGVDFGAFVRRHHCRNCGDIFCDKCTCGRIALTADENAPLVRVCDRCMAEVTQRLANAKEAENKPSGLQSHEDLARKLQEELERNCKSTPGSKSDGSGRKMKEVACPTCTVHLQVQVPISGSETIECGVCHHPFLVSAH